MQQLEGGLGSKPLKSGAESPRRPTREEFVTQQREQVAALKRKNEAAQADKQEQKKWELAVLVRGDGEQDLEGLDTAHAKALLSTIDGRKAAQAVIEATYAKNPETAEVQKQIRFFEDRAKEAPLDRSLWTELELLHQELRLEAAKASAHDSVLRRAQQLEDTLGTAETFVAKQRLETLRAAHIEKGKLSTAEEAKWVDERQNAERQLSKKELEMKQAKEPRLTGYLSEEDFWPQTEKGLRQAGGSFTEPRIPSDLTTEDKQPTGYLSEEDFWPTTENNLRKAGGSFADDRTPADFVAEDKRNEAYPGVNKKRSITDNIILNAHSGLQRTQRERGLQTRDDGPEVTLTDIEMDDPEFDQNASTKRTLESGSRKGEAYAEYQDGSQEENTIPFDLKRVRMEHILELPKNVSAAERQMALERLRTRVGDSTDSLYETLNDIYAERTQAIDNARPLAPLEKKINDVTAAIEGAARLEFYADHDDPQATFEYYEASRDKRKALLNDREAQRVLKAIGEHRHGDWQNQAYITPEIIEALPLEDRALAREWERIELDQMQLKRGIDQIKNHREARAEVSRLQIDALRTCTDCGFPEDVVKAANTPSVHRGDLGKLSDKVFARLSTYDSARTIGERFVKAFHGIAKMFGREYVNADLNKVHKGLKGAQKRLENSLIERNSGRSGALSVLDRAGHKDHSYDFAVTDGSGNRSQWEGGFKGTKKETGDEPLITEKEHNGLQDILTKALTAKENLPLQTDVASTEALLQALSAQLEEYKKKGGNAVRSRVYDLAKDAVNDLHKALDKRFDSVISNENPVSPDKTAVAESVDPVGDLFGDPEALTPKIPQTLEARAEHVKQVTKHLDGVNHELGNAIREQQPLGHFFIQSLESYLGEQEELLKAMVKNGLRKDTSHYDLLGAIDETRELLAKHALISTESYELGTELR
ncbi:hypothetical protein KBA73_03180, partial [Patescibacteria group bacterium]|nr:hypothetical protein [Patescibacteria group bacterium]